jgi:uncharacterized protein with PQ loop repeat
MQNNGFFLQSERFRTFMEKAIYPIGLVGPVITIPQLIQVWMTQDASGLSLVTWGTWILIGVFWLLYGLSKNDRALVYSYMAWIVVEGGVIAGIVAYS